MKKKKTSPTRRPVGNPGEERPNYDPPEEEEESPSFEYDEEKYESRKTDVSVGALLKEMLPKNPYTGKQTAIMVAGFMMVYLVWLWLPAVLFLGMMILIWNLGGLCLKCLHKGVRLVGDFGGKDE